MRNVFGIDEFNDYSPLSSLLSNQSSENDEQIFANITTRNQSISSSTNASFSNKNAYFSVEQLYNDALESCCNCTINVTNENSNSNNLTCNTDYICDTFISQLIEFSANIEGEIINESFFVDDNVR